MDPNQDTPKAGSDDAGAAKPGVVDSDFLKSELDRVLASDVFRRSPGLSELLGYLADHAVREGSDPVTEYAIAQDVLSRGSGFDPKTDPTVRVRIKRLRGALNRYYADHPDGARLAVPPGGYDLTVLMPEGASTERGGASAVGRATKAGILPGKRVLLAACAALICIVLAGVAYTRLTAPAPAIAYPLIEIVPFQNLTGDDGKAIFETGVQRQIASDLQRFGRLRVFQSGATRPDDIAPEYVLRGNILSMDDDIDLSFQLERTSDQAIVYRNRLTGRILGEDYFQAVSEMSRAVSGGIGGRGGAVDALTEAIEMHHGRLLSGDGVSATVLRCVVLEHRFFDDYSPEAMVAARDCFDSLDGAADSDPIARTSLGNLLYHGVPEFDLMETAALPAEYLTTADTVMAIAEETVRAFPGSPEAFLLLGSVQFSMGTLDTANLAIGQSISLNPGSPESHSVLSYLALAQDQPAAALDAGEEALRLSAQPQDFMYFPMILAAIALDDTDRAIALGQAQPNVQRDAPADFIALILSRLTDDEEAAAGHLAALMARADPFEGYSAFIRAPSVQRVMERLTPELVDAAAQE